MVMFAAQKQELRVHQFSFIEMHSEFTIIDLESKVVIVKAWLITDSLINFLEK